VFGSPNRLRALNAIVWPAIAGMIEGELNAAAAAVTTAGAAAPAAAPPATPGASPALVPAPRQLEGVSGLIGVVEAAVLLEAGWDARVGGGGGGERKSDRARVA
jgi:hypothetical protein